jgi:hypothetical protein
LLGDMEIIYDEQYDKDVFMQILEVITQLIFAYLDLMVLMFEF